MKLGDMMKAFRAEHKYTLRDFAEVLAERMGMIEVQEK